MTTVGPSFEVIIRSPNSTLWQGLATAVSSENSTGPFDVLAGHSNFVTMLKKNAEVTLLQPDGSKVKIHCSEAVLAVKDGKVKIYTEV